MPEEYELSLQPMKEGRVILGDERFQLVLKRMCQQLVENYGNFEGTCLIGVQTRGVMLADRIHGILTDLMGFENIPYGKLDITFYRDDFRQREKPLKANQTELEFLLDGKKVILIDDVLYSGRTIQAALTAMNDYGRSNSVELLTLIDRRFNRHLPIKANYTGMVVDALDEAYVRVDWDYDMEGKNRVLLFSDKKTSQEV